MTTTYHEFDSKAIEGALAAVRAHNDTEGMVASGGKLSALAGGEFMVSGGCISVTVGNHKICLNLPLKIGKICIPIPLSVPNGTAAQACLHICTFFGIPTGVRVTISALGHVIVRKTFGRC